MRLPFRLSAILAVAVFAAAGCDSMLTRPLLYNAVRAQVTRRDGHPIPGATLILYTGARQMDLATSDDSGSHLFERVPAGTYGVRTLPPVGFAAMSTVIRGSTVDVADAISLVSDTTVSVRLTLLEIGSGQVFVRLKDPKGVALPGVKVALYDPKHVIANATTDAKGEVLFDPVPFGLHGIEVTRPLFYRDFARYQDSLFAVRDNIVSEKDRSDTATFVLTRCSGKVDVSVLDDAGAPVPASTVAVFTNFDPLGVLATNAAGHAVVEGPCGTQIGVSMNPAPGYTASGRGSAFTDGITLSNGVTVPVILRAHKTP